MSETPPYSRSGSLQGTPSSPGSSYVLRLLDVKFFPVEKPLVLRSLVSLINQYRATRPNKQPTDSANVLLTPWTMFGFGS